MVQGNRAKSLAVVGVNHRTARVELRERFAFQPEAALGLLRALIARDTAREAVLLSTCNRTELYVVLGEGTADVGVAMLAHHAGVLRAEAAPYLYVHEGVACVEHLYRVTAGLDSLVTGEAQIQGQVKAAYELAAGAPGVAGLPLVGPALSRLFQSALAAGGRVRSQTALGAGAASVPSAAVELAVKVLGSLRDRQVVVLGAGEMSRLAAEVLVKEGVRPPVIVSRTSAHALRLAADVGGTAAGFERMSELLASADLFVSATSAPHVLVTPHLMQQVRAQRGHQLCIIDLAVPRDVDPAVAELSGVFLFDLDDLRRVVDSNLERRRAESAAAEQLIAAATAEYRQWIEARDAVPVIRTMRGHAEAVRQREVQKALGRLAHLPPVEQARIEHLTQQLVNKILHAPTVKLREAAANGDGVMLLDAARYLFE